MDRSSPWEFSLGRPGLSRFQPHQKSKAAPSCSDIRLETTTAPRTPKDTIGNNCQFSSITLQSWSPSLIIHEMRFSSVLALGGLLASALAHNIQLAAHSRECFHEQLHKDDRMTVTFQVGDREFQQAGNLDVDFWVR